MEAIIWQTNEYEPPEVWTWSPGNGGVLPTLIVQLPEQSMKRIRRLVNKVSGIPGLQLHERDDASDFDTKTQEKLLKQ